eukprot:gene2220-17825_t
MARCLKENPGSWTIPTQNLPRKSIQRNKKKTDILSLQYGKDSKDGRPSSKTASVKRETSNEASAHQSTSVPSRCYKSFKEMCARSQNLKLRYCWTSEARENDCLFIKRGDDSFELNKFEVYIDTSLNFTVRVYAWEIPENHKLYQKFARSVENVTISNLVCCLENNSLCSGIDCKIFQLSAAFVKHNGPHKHYYSVKGSKPLDQTEYSRSPSCLNGLQYVLTERFCQDSLENYFGHQRSLGRRKDNPTLRDFGYNDNTIRNLKDLQPIAGGNVHSAFHEEVMSIDSIPLPSRKKKKTTI